jgi:probable rRNA maturation factor
MDLDILIEDARWQDIELDALATDAIRTALQHLTLNPDTVELSLLACDDQHIATLNASFRDKPTATNVLSWPAEDLSAVEQGTAPRAPTPDPGGALALGDIAIAYDTCAREARAQNKPLSAHVQHLIVHGLLHLLGYDHIRDRDATLMEGVEVEILGKLGLDDPYMDR